MSATDASNIIYEETLIQTSSKLVVCKYGTGDASVQVQVPKDVICLFRIFRDINDVCHSGDEPFYANIPIINDSIQVPIYFNKDELALFFELSAKEPLTIQHLEDSAITPELLIRFILLVNFLDYEIYANTLCKYAAFLVFLNRLDF